MSKKKILFVDDEKDLCQLVKISLEETGHYEVRIEIRGSAVLPAVDEFEPDLIFLDIVLPDLVGSAVAYQLQDHDRARDIPIIFLTALVAGDDQYRQASDFGDHYIVAKPISTEQLIEHIENRLN